MSSKVIKSHEWIWSKVYQWPDTGNTNPEQIRCKNRCGIMLSSPSETDGCFDNGHTDCFQISQK